MADMRLIDANALVDKVRLDWGLTRQSQLISTTTKFATADAMCKLLGEVAKSPTVDAELVVHAHWKVRRGIPFCSNCLEIINGYSCDHDISTTPRCSFCGAKMDGGDT